MNKTILISLSVIAAVAAIAVGGTVAYFSDTETSAGNTFTAGGIDLKIDYDCYFNKVADGEPNCGGWDLKSLTDEKFFDFGPYADYDLKPGDFGEGTISLHVFNNDAWGAFTIDNIVDTDNDITEPEDEADGVPANGSDGTDNDGDLDSGLELMVWMDQGCTPGFQCAPDEPKCSEDIYEGDNVWQTCPGVCPEPTLFSGSGSQGSQWVNVENDINPTGETWALSDAIKAVYAFSGGAYEDDGITQDGRLKGSITYYIGVAWKLIEETDNIAQTDTWGADLTFEVTQARNQDDPYTSQ